jgi:hypothetical protein
VLSLSPLYGSHKIFVIHGYATPRIVMKKIDKCLKKANYATENYSYKSISVDLDTLGKQLYNIIEKSGYDSVSFVTHSMGALVVRSMLQYSIKDKSFPVIFRMVMIAPPNKGAEIADFYSSLFLVKKLLGPNVRHMTTDSGSYTNKLPIPNNSEIGIIIGIRGKKHGYNLFIKGDNDWVLTPEKTKLGIEKDRVFIKHRHIALLRQKIVCNLVIEFLASGTFISMDKN